MRYAAEITDHNHRLGGKTTRLGFLGAEEASQWAQAQCLEAKEWGIHATYQVVKYEEGGKE